MIFGQTKEDKQNKRIEQFNNWIKHGKSKFAFIPVKMENGQWLWFEKYRIFLSGHSNPGEYMAYGYFQECFYKRIAERDILIEKLKGR